MILIKQHLEIFIRKIWRRFFPAKSVSFQKWTSKNDVKLNSSDDEISLITNNSQTPIYLRTNSSDTAVFTQVYIEEEYSRTFNLIDQYIRTPQLAIDCGANIGLTSRKLAERFSGCKIYALEPDKNNYTQLIKNTLAFKNIAPLFNAVWSKACKVKIESNFRDGLDWSKQVDVKEDGEIDALTIEQILEISGQNLIDFLKIDIEGGERELFKDMTTAGFMAKTKILALEIHDEYQIRKDIYKILKAYNFSFFNDVELTICLNKNLL